MRDARGRDPRAFSRQRGRLPGGRYDQPKYCPTFAGTNVLISIRPVPPARGASCSKPTGNCNQQGEVSVLR